MGILLAGAVRFRGTSLPPPASSGPNVDPLWRNVVSLLRFNGANASTNAIDSRDILTHAFSGSAAINTSQSRFGGASGRFPGENDFIRSNASSAIALGSGDFTVECWYYPVASSGQFPRIFEITQSANGVFGPGSFGLMDRGLAVSKYGLFAHSISSSGNIVASSTSNVIDGQWAHLMLSKSQNVYRFYVDGSLEFTFANSSSLNSGPCYLWWGGGGEGTNATSNSFIDDARLTVGVSRDKELISPPKSQLTVVPDTQILLNFNGADNSTTFTDSTGLRSWTGSGARITTAQSRFGGSSAIFNGTTDMITPSSSSGLNLSGDFTIEAWLRPTAITSGNRCIITTCNDAFDAGGITLHFINGTTSLAVFNYISNNALLSANNTPIPLNRWSHVALVRRGTSIPNTFLYIDGRLAASVFNTQTIASPDFSIGRWKSSSFGSEAQGFTGLIDDVRVTNGTALYNGSFTPPTTEAAVNPIQYFDWNALDNNNRVSLTNSNRVARANGANGVTKWVRSLTGKSSGKWRVSFVIDEYSGSTGQHAIGFGTSSGPGAYIGANSSSWGYWGDYGGNGRLFNNGAFVQYNGFGMATGDRFDILIDIDAGRAWWRKNGIIISGNPAAGTGAMATFTPGSTIFMMTDIYGTTGSTRILTRPGEMMDSPVTGFVDGWPDFELSQPSDPFIDNVTSLIHGDQVAGSTNIVDRNNHSWTAFGNAVISNDNALFGKSSIFFDGSGDVINTPANSSAFSFPDDFTVEFWLRPNVASFANQKTLWDNSINQIGNFGLGIGLQTNMRPYLYNYQNGTFVIQSATALVENKWTHLAVSRTGTTTRMFMDGISVGSTTGLRQDIVNGAALNVGGHSTAGAQFSFSGNMAEIRVTKGEGRYISNFSVPFMSFPHV